MPHTFHNDIAVAVLGSGSRGNATYIGDGAHGVLVDCGLSTKQVFERLAAVGLENAPIDAVLITHEHSDHVAAAAVLDRRLFKQTGRHVPFLATSGTLAGLNARCRPTRTVSLDSATGSALPTSMPTRWRLDTHRIPHDTRDPVSFTIDVGGTRIAVLTDLGHVNPEAERQLAQADLAVLEFNHDLEMLQDGPYPWQLKERIRGSHGHLSNAQAGALLTRASRSGRLQEVVLAHLSEDNNTPAHALEAAYEAAGRAGRTDLRITAACQSEPLGPLSAQVAPAYGALPTSTPAQQQLFA